MPAKDDERKMMKSLAVSGELRQGRYFKIRRVVKAFEDIDEYCDQQETKDGSMDTVLSWMKDSSAKQDQVGNTILKMGKILKGLDKKITALEDKE